MVRTFFVSSENHSLGEACRYAVLNKNRIFRLGTVYQ